MKIFIYATCIFLLSVPYRILADDETTTTMSSAGNVSETTTEISPTAEKLVRYRRQPLTVIRHILSNSKRSKPRRRFKRPKIKYGPPNYKYGEPLTYYKPHVSYEPPSSPDLTFLGDDIKNFNFGNEKYEPSSYDSFSMNLNFFGNDEQNEFHSNKPSGSSASNYIPEEPKVHVPHTRYGIPTSFQYSNEFHKGKPGATYSDLSLHSGSFENSPTIETDTNAFIKEGPGSFSSPSYEPANSGPGWGGPPQEQYNYVEKPGPAYENQGFELYEKPPEKSVNSFAPNSYNGPNVEITYSPSYEINPSHSYKEENYGENGPPLDRPGPFAEPPAHPPANKENYKSSSNGPNIVSNEYIPPTQDLPINFNYNYPNYDFPKSSYEVPIYDPIPFDSSNRQENEFYPPHFPETHSNHESNESENSQSLDAEKQENKLVPQYHLNNSPNLDALNNCTNKSRRTRGCPKRKGFKPGETISSKHNLDAPELKQAFEADKTKRYPGFGLDAFTDESNISNKRQKLNAVASTTATLSSTKQNRFNAWNPMRVTSNGKTISTPSFPLSTTLTNIDTSSTNARPKYTTKSRRNNVLGKQTGTTLLTPNRTNNFWNSPKTTTDISIQKSISNSYYDGTIRPPTVTLQNLQRHTKPKRFKMTTVQGRPDSTTRSTTNSYFDTTYFKSPRDTKLDARQKSYLEQSLPKNHKLF